jgi:hypothetical protein
MAVGRADWTLMGSIQQQDMGATQQECSPGLNVSSFMPSSLYTEVGAPSWPTRLARDKQLSAWHRTTTDHWLFGQVNRSSNSTVAAPCRAQHQALFRRCWMVLTDTQSR